MRIEIINSEKLNLKIISELIDGIGHFNVIDEANAKKRYVRHVWKIDGVELCTIVEVKKFKVVIDVFTVDTNKMLSRTFDEKQ